MTTAPEDPPSSPREAEPPQPLSSPLVEGNTTVGWKSKIHHLWRHWRQFKLPKSRTEWSDQFFSFSGRLKNAAALSLENVLFSLQELDPETLWRRVVLFFEKNQHHWAYSPQFLIPLSSLFLADLTTLLIQDYLPPPPRSNASVAFSVGGPQISLSDYQAIFQRNLFSSDGLIPEDETQDDSPFSSILKGPAVKSSLDLVLLGTLILENNALSVANIEDKTTHSTYPVQIHDEIPEKIQVLDIETRKVTFINLKSRKKEYIEMADPFANLRKKMIVGNEGVFTQSSGIQKGKKNQFLIPRAKLDQALGPEFSTVLTQARAIPNYENGTQAGFKLIQIVPGSIYEDLGIQNGDIILGVNGSPINDVAKATEMFHEFKTAKHIELQLNKNGKVVTHYYDVQ